MTLVQQFLIGAVVIAIGAIAFSALIECDRRKRRREQRNSVLKKRYG